VTRNIGSLWITPSDNCLAPSGSAAKAVFNRNCVAAAEPAASISVTTKTRSQRKRSTRFH
jgi:hypothetical protein